MKTQPRNHSRLPTHTKKSEYYWTKLDSKDGKKGGSLDMRMDLKMGLRMVKSIWRMRSCKATEKEGKKGSKMPGRRMQRLRQRNMIKAGSKEWRKDYG
jgi:hypothetical protein